MHMTRIHSWTIVLLALVLGGHVPVSAADIRAADYDSALQQAKSTGRDIVVFQRGSDWNWLGETLYHTVWSQEAFARELGDGFILVAVDRPEHAGAPPLPVRTSTGLPAAAGDGAAGRRAATLVDGQAAPPPSELTAVASAAKVTFTRRPDGAFLGSTTPKPDHDTVTLTLPVQRGGRILRLDFLTDPTLPGGGPGWAENGNFVISEIEVRDARTAYAIDAAWASGRDGSRGIMQIGDGIADKPDNGWNPGVKNHEPRTLLLVLQEALPAGAVASIRLVCNSTWKRHVPGCLRAAVLADPSLEARVRASAEAHGIIARNASFSWWDGSVCPRIALMDRQGRAVASENRPRSGLTPATMAARVKDMRTIRERRDALWARAEAAQGAQRAEWLRQGLDVMGFANWAGNDKCYASIHEQIRAADPKDDSGAVRWLTFGGDPRDGLKWAEPSWSKALEKKSPTDEDFREALVRIDRELQDPRNRVLDHERLQRIMVAKYRVYSRWPKHEEQRFDVQRAIAALDPDTFWGIGAIGDLAMNHRTATPMLTYGWDARQVKPGLNIWDMADTAYVFDHAGPYRIVVLHKGGKDTVLIRRIALLDGATVLAEARPDARLGPDDAAVAADLELKTWAEDRRLVLRVETETTNGGTDSRGGFSIESQLLPPPASTGAPAMTDEVSRMLAGKEIHALHRKIGDALMEEVARGDVGRVVASPALRTSLMQYTLIHQCGTGMVEAIADRDGGVPFLQSLFGDADWLESFLASDKAIWPASWAFALENLHLLHRHGTGWEIPINKRIGTALALQWGHYDRDWRYLLVERFGLIKQALEEGLMHSSFEDLDVRAMRWAVQTQGRRRDFRFLLDDRQTRLTEYLGAHGAVRYLTNNVYGVSIHDGTSYYMPWAHAYGTFSLPVHRRVGGVCGACSSYGSAQAVVHGIPSTPIGQPGHCAFVVRVGQEWRVGNSVTWPSNVTIRGWDGTNYPTMNRLYEPVSQDRERLLAATRLGWLAQLQAHRAMAQVRFLPGMQYRLYRTGVGAKAPDFSRLTADRSGPCWMIDMAEVAPYPARAFAAVWEGAIEVGGNGPVVVGVNSSGSSQVFIDGAQVVGSAGRKLQQRELTLAPGRHSLRVAYHQGSGDPRLSLAWEGVLPSGSGAWMQTYEQAILAQPINYLTWIDYITLLESAKNVPSGTWLDLGRRAARTFKAYNEAGWALVRRCFDRAFPEMTPAERMAALLACNQELRQENWYKPDTFPYDGILTWQADRIGDTALAVEFLGRMLAIHHNDNPDRNFIFGQVLDWGTRRFAGNPKTAAGYAKAMAAFFTAEGDGVNKGLLATTLKNGLRKASDSGDLVSFRLWADMAEKMLPALKPGDVHLNAKQAADYPRFKPFPGEVLSRDGMLQISSAHADNQPLSFRQLLGGEAFGGWFDTDSDAKPWAQVQLAGEAELSGIVLVNRYEYAPATEAFQKPVPFDVLVSLDGTAWTKVASFEKAETVFRVDLQDKDLKARHVRLERRPKAGESVPIKRFYLRGFVVYGRKLY